LVWVVTYAASPKKESFPGLAAFFDFMDSAKWFAQIEAKNRKDHCGIDK